MATDEGEITGNGLHGLKYSKLLGKLLSRLHGAACARDRAHNRDLHMDQYMSLLVLSFFNPVNESLRGIQHASALKRVQRKLGVGRFSMGCQRWGDAIVAGTQMTASGVCS